MKKNESEPLFSEFKAATPGEWREAAEKLLKGAPYEKIMERDTPEGIRLKPLFWKEILDELPASDTLPGFDGFRRGTKAAGHRAHHWEISQEIPYGTPEELNKALLADLARGQNAVHLLLDPATIKGFDPESAGVGDVGACGVSLASLDDLRTLFRDVLPEAVPFHFRSVCSGMAVGAFFFAWLGEKQIDPAAIKGSLGMDPLACWASTGTLPADLGSLLREQRALAGYCAEHAPGVRAVDVATIPYHRGGASAVEELGAGLATAAFYLADLVDGGLPVDQAARQIRFHLSIGGDFFMELAKIRAIRSLWAHVVEAFGGDEESRKMELHARTGFLNKTRHDPYTNILRTTTEALAGVLGGVDSLCVGTFDETLQAPDTFSRRIARNIQIILSEECELTATADPGGGAWEIEWLTEEVARKSWEFFQEIEGEGGIKKVLKSGFLRERLGQTAAAREHQFYHRRTTLVGTNAYPNPEEELPENNLPDYAALRKSRIDAVARYRQRDDEDADNAVMEALGTIVDNQSEHDRFVNALEAARAGATLGEMTKSIRHEAGPAEAIHPMPARRLAATYEELRAASRAWEESQGEPPTVFLCNLGPLRRHKIRADFTRDFFQTGGFKVRYPEGFDNPGDAVRALIDSGAWIAVVCGTDDDYAEHFTTYARAIQSEDPDVRILLAGHPGERETEFREAGMDDFIHIKSNNFETNRRYLEFLGVL